MRIRAAGGLLMAVLLYPLARELDLTGARAGLGDTLRNLLWFRGDVDGKELFSVLMRDGLLVGGAVVALCAIAGFPWSRYLVPLTALAIAACSLPTLIYDLVNFSAGSDPPRWVIEYRLWFVMGRWTTGLWLLVLGAAAVLAVSDPKPRSAFEERRPGSARTPRTAHEAGPGGPEWVDPAQTMPEWPPPTTTPPIQPANQYPEQRP